MSFNVGYGFEQAAKEIIKESMRQKEIEILSQLNDFISRDLIVVEEGPTTMVRDPLSSKIEIRTSVRLVLKDKEYIEELERENKELKELIEKLKGVLT